MAAEYAACVALYLIEILHQTTTKDLIGKSGNRLYLIEILHQTTTSNCNSSSSHVVSYRNSTSNHNAGPRRLEALSLYLIEILHQTTTI